MRDPETCSHVKTVEIFKGIFKCSSCGDTWDEANEQEKEQRQEGLEAGVRMRERKADRIERYKRKARYG